MDTKHLKFVSIPDAMAEIENTLLMQSELKKREEIEGQLRDAEPRLDKIKEDARKDGGQPGWFRGLEPPPPPGPTPTPDIVID